jgi:hypothetical protein
MSLSTKRIDELNELTAPGSDVWLVVRDTVTGKDYKVKKSNLLSGASATYEWQAGTTYAAGQLVSWGGLWWKSLIGANTGNIPSENANWTQVLAADESSIKAFQAGYVYKGTLVVVLYNDRIYRLANLTRPYSAATFVDADWTKIDGALRYTVTTTGGTITLDAKNGMEVIFEGSASIGAVKTWAFANETAAQWLKILFTISAVAVQTFPPTVKMANTLMEWDSSAFTWTPNVPGIYEAELTKMGSSWLMKINGPF